MGENWIQNLQKDKHLSPTQINDNAKQPIIETWIQKLRLTRYAKQTHPKWTIHPQYQKLIQETETIWKQLWGPIKNLIKEKRKSPQYQLRAEKRLQKIHLRKHRQKQHKQIKNSCKNEQAPRIQELKENTEKHAHLRH